MNISKERSERLEREMLERLMPIVEENAETMKSWGKGWVDAFSDFVEEFDNNLLALLWGELDRRIGRIVYLMLAEDTQLGPMSVEEPWYLDLWQIGHDLGFPSEITDESLRKMLCIGITAAWIE